MFKNKQKAKNCQRWLTLLRQKAAIVRIVWWSDSTSAEAPLKQKWILPAPLRPVSIAGVFNASSAQF